MVYGFGGCHELGCVVDFEGGWDLISGKAIFVLWNGWRYSRCPEFFLYV